ncbi:MAG: LLM class flavin-dependent oxidoreductase [Pseudomonadota bacterium]|nr:LLM class flavin-dependent oxidoreductase [Pseudomonadota bacterium]
MKQIRLNAFDMNCVGHIQQGMWRHPRDRSADYLSLDHWVGLARTLEHGLFDGLFLADVLGVYDVYEGSPAASVRDAVQVPVNDPTLLIPAMAHATEHLGFGVTANLSYEAPYVFARRMSTLDHLSGGRIGWNIVTGYLDSAARAMGLARQVAHDERYDVADEYMEVVYKLWEGSWADDAVVRDRERGVYADPGRVRAVRHQGARFQVEGVHLSEPSPQRTPVLYQAGSSGRGRRFAASHAECVFVNGTSKATVASIVADIRAEAVACGRAPTDVLVFVGATVVVGATDAEAGRKLADYQRYASVEGALAQASGSLGVDFASYGPDDPIRMVKTQAIVSNLEAITTRRPEQVMTKRKLAGSMVLGGRQAPIVGGAERVADELAAWVAEADVDGFILARTVAPECFEDFVELVVPRLQERGVYKEAYARGSLREKLFGRGSARLPGTHPAASWRW